MSRERQIQREEQMLEAGQERYRRSWQKAKAGGNLVAHPAVKANIKYFLDNLAREIEAYIDKATSGNGGRHNGAVKYIKDMDPAVMSYLTCRYVLNGLLDNQTLALTERNLGRAVEDEQWLSRFEQENPGAFGWVTRQLTERGVPGRFQRRYMYLRVSQYKGFDRKAWTTSEAVLVGKVLIHLFARSCPSLVRVATVFDGRKKINFLKPMDGFEDLLFHSGENMGLVRPILGPMIHEPIEWSAGKAGGFYTIPLPLVKRSPMILKAEVAKHEKLLEAAELGQVYKAINALNRTAFAINEPVLNVLEHIWTMDLQVAGVPNREPLPLPFRPEECDEDKDAQKSWRKMARNVHEANERSLSKRLDIGTCIETAKSLVGEEKLYFPNQLDFRGRVYQLPTSLHTQGPDYSRALLRFAEGKHITTVEAMEWLMIHGANMWGYDKVSLADRVVWVNENLRKIAEVDADPYSNTWWHEADKPFQFLAWCLDYMGVLKRGKPSYIRVAMDGSCNGLQHLSAMLRDPVGAKAVNLAPSSEPRDIYQEVADVVIEKLKQATGQEREWARVFLAVGVDRKLTKRSVMVMPYGGKFKSTMSYVEEAFLDKVDNKSPFGSDHKNAIVYLSRLVFDATREVIQGGAIVMDWLQKVASVAGKAGVHLKWTTPHGFVAKQTYSKRVQHNIRTTLDGGSEMKTSIHEPTKDVDVRRSTSAISPNFVHSMDAAALMMTINKAVDRGIGSFHMVHDDYGTHAADTEVLCEVLREAFVELYRDNDILGAFYREALEQIPEKYHVDIPEPPKPLGFDIEEVLGSKYFFA